MVPARAAERAVRGRDAGLRIATAALPQAGAVRLLGVPRATSRTEPLQASYRPNEGYEVRILSITPI